MTIVASEKLSQADRISSEAHGFSHVRLPHLVQSESP